MMKIYLLILFLVISAVPSIPVLAQGFFIPQKTLDSLRQPEKLPPVNYQPATKQVQAPKVTTPKSNTQANSGAIAKPQPTQIQKNIATNAPKPQPNNREKSQPAVDDSQPEGILVLPPDQIPTFNYGEVIEPVFNTEPSQPQGKAVVEHQSQTPAVAPARERKMTFDDIIDEYKQDIDKISKNQPAENARLQIMLKKYHDEEIIYN